MPNRETVPGLADKLRAAREAVEMSQQDAADRSGVHQVSIARYETDKSTPTIPVLYKLAEAYGVKPADLLPEPAKKPRKS